jgi:uncharacterized protein with GYD domain
MSYLQLSRTRPTPGAWEGLTDVQNDAQTAAIYAVIGECGGAVKVVAFSPSELALTSVIEYPDEKSAQQSIARILALGTLEFVSIESLWDLGDWIGMVRAAAANS